MAYPTTQQLAAELQPIYTLHCEQLEQDTTEEDCLDYLDTAEALLYCYRYNPKPRDIQQLTVLFCRFPYMPISFVESAYMLYKQAYKTRSLA